MNIISEIWWLDFSSFELKRCYHDLLLNIVKDHSIRYNINVLVLCKAKKSDLTDHKIMACQVEVGWNDSFKDIDFYPKNIGKSGIIKFCPMEKALPLGYE
jgi:hypothetical protein